MRWSLLTYPQPEVGISCCHPGSMRFPLRKVENNSAERPHTSLFSTVFFQFSMLRLSVIMGQNGRVEDLAFVPPQKSAIRQLFTTKTALGELRSPIKKTSAKQWNKKKSENNHPKKRRTASLCLYHPGPWGWHCSVPRGSSSARRSSPLWKRQWWAFPRATQRIHPTQRPANLRHAVMARNTVSARLTAEWPQFPVTCFVEDPAAFTAKDTKASKASTEPCRFHWFLLCRYLHSQTPVTWAPHHTLPSQPCWILGFTPVASPGLGGYKF